MPSLAQVLEVTKGKISLNIELKGDDPKLVAAINETLKTHEFEDFEICSFERWMYDEVKRLGLLDTWRYCHIYGGSYARYTLPTDHTQLIDQGFSSVTVRNDLANKELADSLK